MSNAANKILKKEYERLKNVLKKILNPKRKNPVPQLVLQPLQSRNTPVNNTGQRILVS
jgi:hypothetical protein